MSSNHFKDLIFGVPHGCRSGPHSFYMLFALEWEKKFGVLIAALETCNAIDVCFTQKDMSIP